LPSDRPSPHFLRRRAVLAAGIAATLPATLAAAKPLPTLRLGVLQFGTVQWLAETIRGAGLDTAHGITLVPVTLAGSAAGHIGLMGNAVDVVVVDWLFAAARTAAGTKLSFAPFSAALGGLMVAASSPIHGIADLRGRRIGIAGGATDKSFLLLQAAARLQGIDIKRANRIAYAAPPLLEEKLLAGDFDAVLTFWNFAARLEANGCREAVPMSRCAALLGLPASLDLLGFVFHTDWAMAHRPAIDGFLAAAYTAQQRLATDPAAWAAIRPLMRAPTEALFTQLRQRFIAGIQHPDAAAEQRTAERVFRILHATGGAAATEGLATLPPGIFWPATPA
jgi:NitT/TauT family transport system substrate-binding protein